MSAAGNQEEIQTPEEYINENLKEISLSDSWTEGTMGNTEEYQVFLAGENHGVEEDYETQKRLIEYLYTHEGVRYLIFERSVSEGIILEKYIQTGEEELLTDYMNSIAGTAGYTQGEYQFFKWLYQYNMSLPEGERLHMFGLDLEFQQDMTIKALQMLDANGEVEAYYGEKWKWVERILKNEEKYFQHISEGASAESQLRDNNMAENFWFVYDQFPEGKFFGQFGAFHTYLEYTTSVYQVEQGHRPFAALLDQEGSFLTGKVCSILLYNISDASQYNEINRHIEALKNVKLRGKNMLLSLNEKGSPFVNEEIWQEEEEERPVCDYIQKIVFLQAMTKSPSYGE